MMDATYIVNSLWCAVYGLTFGFCVGRVVRLVWTYRDRK